MTEATQPADERNVPAARTRGPRCHCGAPIAHTPGKRPRVYCSERCKKAARRAIARNASQSLTVTGTTTDGKRDRRLGTTYENCNPSDGASTTKPQVRAGVGPRPVMTPLARRDARYDLLDGLQHLTTSKRLRSCRRMLKTRSGAATLTTGTGGGSFAGVCVCGSVHLCPVCAARIRAARAEQADTWVDAWTAAGGGVAFWTLTMRHYKRQPLGSLRRRERHGLVAQQHDAWRRAFGHRAGRHWQRIMREHDIAGYYRVWECTCGARGWHPHFHVLLFTDRPWGEDTRASFEAAAAARWSAALVKSGAYKPNEAGCRVDLVKGNDPGAAGRYLFKEQDGRAGIEKIGTEMTRGDMKTGRRGGRAPFEIAQAAVDGDADAVQLWREFEAGTYGLRLMYLSNGMRARLDALVRTDDRTDEEIAADDGADRTPVALFPAETWHRHVTRVRGRRLALIKAVEAGGQPAVRALVESWGLVWGRDVLDPPPTPEGGEQAGGGQ